MNSSKTYRRGGGGGGGGGLWLFSKEKKLTQIFPKKKKNLPEYQYI